MKDIGITRRMKRLFPEPQKTTLIVPLDDSLLSGPFGGLQKQTKLIKSVLAAEPNAIMAFPGTLFSTPFPAAVERILNLTVSTTLGNHVRKVENNMLRLAIESDCAAVSHHINFGNKHEPEMLESLAKTCLEAHSFGIPVMALAYLRRRKAGKDDNFEELATNNVDEYFAKLSHCVRVAAELGADIIKTSIACSNGPWELLADAALNARLVLAGGPVKEKSLVIEDAQKAIKSGFSGLSIGRNVFHSQNPEIIIKELKQILKDETQNH